MIHKLFLKHNIKISLKFSLGGLAVSLILNLISNHPEIIIETSIIGAVIGFLIGAFENFVTFPKLRKMPFPLVMIIRTLVYSLIIILSIIMLALVKLSIMNQCSLFDAFERDQLLEFIISNDLHIVFIVLMTLAFFLNAFWQINLLLGRGVLWKYVTGKYHKPKTANKIFLFLDLKSSTTIAEKIGSVKYSQFLQDFFYDLTEPILQTKGSIFQYCGDEVVVLWKAKDGLKNNNALRFFFLVEEKILSLKDKYVEKYGVFPEYKAGVHYGNILVTEVGYLKKEIAYHGDLINTASRIRSTCNKVNRRLLASEDLLKNLPNWKSEFNAESMGEFKLRGKKNIIKLFSIEEKGKRLAPLDENRDENEICIQKRCD